MAGILAGAAPGARRHPPRDDPYGLRADILEGERGKSGAVTLPRLAEHAWDAGIAVAHLPPLAFRAACFGGDGAGRPCSPGGAASEPALMLDLARAMCRAARGRDSIDVDGRGAGAEGSEAGRTAKGSRRPGAAMQGPRRPGGARR